MFLCLGIPFELALAHPQLSQPSYSMVATGCRGSTDSGPFVWDLGAFRSRVADLGLFVFGTDSALKVLKPHISLTF